MPEAVYNKWNLQPETRRVFRQATTGSLGATFRTSPEGPRTGNIWDSLHRAYNDAVKEVSERFFRVNNIKPDGSNMTPPQARAMLKEVSYSEDPRIRDFDLNMRRIRRFRTLRSGEE